MNLSTPPDPRQEVCRQFSKQAAIPLSELPAITNEKLLKLLVDLSSASKEDTVLDLACGPGLVVCAFAGTIRRADGVHFSYPIAVIVAETPSL